MKKRSERRKHCALAVVRRSQKFSALHRPVPGGAGRPKFNQLEMVTTFTYKPSLARIDASNFELSWYGNKPTHTHEHTHTHTHTNTHTHTYIYIYITCVHLRSECLVGAVVKQEFHNINVVFLCGYIQRRESLLHTQVHRAITPATCEIRNDKIQQICT